VRTAPTAARVRELRALSGDSHARLLADARVRDLTLVAGAHGGAVAVHRADEVVELSAREAPLAAGCPVAADVPGVGPATNRRERDAQVARGLRTREDELSAVAWEHCTRGHVLGLVVFGWLLVFRAPLAQPAGRFKGRRRLQRNSDASLFGCRAREVERRRALWTFSSTAEGASGRVAGPDERGLRGAPGAPSGPAFSEMKDRLHKGYGT